MPSGTLAQIRTIDAWWRRHRKDSPELFTVGLAEALSLAALLTKRRKSLGYTQTEVADLNGSSQSRVVKMEAGAPIQESRPIDPRCLVAKTPSCRNH